MIRVEKVETWGWEHAIRGMRNPMNSWTKSDSYICDAEHCKQCQIPFDERDCYRPDGYVIGPNDLGLMQKLYKAGTEHRKFMRQIFISMDVIAPLYWWKEFDQYKIGVVTDSCSSMHKIHSKEFTLDEFSHEHLSKAPVDVTYQLNGIYVHVGAKSAYEHLIETIAILNSYREKFIKTKDKEDRWQMIQLLPSSYNQRRTLTMNYEVAATIIRQRTGHKLDEWNELVGILKKLPYMAEIINQEGGR